MYVCVYIYIYVEREGEREREREGEREREREIHHIRHRCVTDDEFNEHARTSISGTHHYDRS